MNIEKNEELHFTTGIVIIIAVAAFIIGLVTGIVCSPRRKPAKPESKTFNAIEYAKSLNLENEDNDDELLAFEL